LDNDEFRRAIEAIKLRAPIEDVVRERVPALRKSGALWVACCPFHDEKTPSFKVDPRRGTWHCFGACGAGGDQISFIERCDNLAFMDALEILAARTGVALPRRRTEEPAEDAKRESIRRVLDHAVRFFRRELMRPEGARALRYAEERKLSPAILESFSVGYAPANGQALVQDLRAAGLPFESAVAAGLARQNDQGRAYDFFRGRWMIPIRDHQGHVVGFGGRRLDDDDASGPKYVNTAETPLFHKGSLIYALDRAIAHVRRSGHVVLVEGYTDVMAAHQVGLENVVAVLGTATTDDHAALLRKSGARRISLVFDGDEAGRKATYKALTGLLPLDVEIDVVCLRGGDDPCDLLTREGSAPLLAELELARPWFDFLVDGLAGLRGAELSRAVDRVLELLGRVAKPVQRESLLSDLAARLALPVESLREQWRTLRGDARPAKARTSSSVAASTSSAVPSSASSAVIDPMLRRAFADMIGALLCDASLVPLARPFVEMCPEPALSAVLQTIMVLYADADATIDAASVMAALGENEARNCVVPIHEHAAKADSPRALLDGQLKYLKSRRLDLEARELERELAEQDRKAAEASGGDASGDPRTDELFRRLHANRAEKRELQAH
jgi:DNA primase